MNVELNIDKQVHVFVDFVGVFIHQTGKCFTLDEFRNDCPFAVNHADFQKFWNRQAGFFNSRLIERLVEDIGFL